MKIIEHTCPRLSSAANLKKVNPSVFLGQLFLILVATFWSIGAFAQQTPYLSDPIILPATIQAENYDNGGQHVSYYDTSPSNTLGAYREGDVDVGVASHGGYALGYNEVGEWLEYSVLVKQPGTYLLSALVSSKSDGGSLVFHFSGATAVSSKPISIGSTGEWTEWKQSTSAKVDLNQGAHIVRLNFVSGNINISEFKIELLDLPLAYPEYTGRYDGFSLVHDERFDSLNAAIWEKGDGAVVSESDCRFVWGGARTAEGKLELIIKRQFVAASWSKNHKKMMRNYDYSCGELRTLPSKGIKYGRVEVRMKAPLSDDVFGFISSMFTYYNDGVPREWEEIDIELEGANLGRFQSNLIYGIQANDWTGTHGFGIWSQKIDIPRADQWRVFAFEWTPDAIKWFVDGVEFRVLKQGDLDCIPRCVAPQIYATPIPDNTASLMLNSWIPTELIQSAFGGDRAKNRYPIVTQYDWLRIYQFDSHPLDNWK